MKKIYPYKGFEITVELEPVRALSTNVWLLTPQGFIAVVHVQAAGESRDLLSPTRLMADGQRPFATEAQALMAAYSAAQRLVDDTLVA
jgi:hypothetical protein